MSTSTIMPVIQPIEGEIGSASLAHLHQAIVDARDAAGSFEQHAGAEAKPVLAEFRNLHANHDRALVTMMAEHGHAPDEGGSFASLLHSGVARLRDLFGGSDRDAIAQLIDGERELVGAYNDALMHGGPPDLVELLQRQRDEVAAHIERHDPASSTRGAHPSI